MTSNRKLMIMPGDGIGPEVMKETLRLVDWLAKNNISKTMSTGSSVKFCLIAAGEADVYPRFGATMEWDTAAGDAVLRAAGGRVVGLDGKDFKYGKNKYKNDPFIALGKFKL